LSAKGDYEAAIKEYHLAMERNPNDFNCLNNLGIALASLNQMDQAVGAFKQAIAVNPDYARAHHNLGNVYYAKGEAPNAIEEYQLALKLDPGDEESRQLLKTLKG